MKYFSAIFAVTLALLSLVYKAEAVDCSYQQPGCATTKEYIPVCGENGCTYNNPSLAYCGGTTLAYPGPCSTY